MSDTEEGEVKLSKEERLEAAKKKFEELKAKNKKKKKSKKAKKDSEKEGSVPLEDEDENKSADLAAEPEAEASTETTETKESPEVTEEETAAGTKEPKEEEEKAEEADNTNTEEIAVAESEEAESAANNVPSAQPAESTEADTNATEGTATQEPAEDAKPDSPLQETEESGKSWLDEIQETAPAAASPAPETASTPAAEGDDTVESLKAIIAQRDTQIQELKHENTDLRMNKFELLEKIETLESTVKKLNSKLNAKKIDAPVYQSDYNSELSLSPEPTPYLHGASGSGAPHAAAFVKTPSFQNFHQDAGYGQQYAASSADLRDRLLKWKDWQVDMRNWRSIVAGPVVEL